MKEFQIPNHLKEQYLKVMGVTPGDSKRSRLKPIKDIKKYLSAKFYITLPGFLQKIFKRSQIAVRYSTIMALIIILAFGPLAYIRLRKPQSAEATWFDDSWMYRKKIEITYSGSSTLTGYQVLIDGLDTATLVTNGKMQSDCDDIRFTSHNGVLLDYFIVGNTCNTSDTEIWVKTDTIPSSNITIYIYYGNPSAASYQSEAKTFSYSSEKTVGYVLSNRYASLDLISLEDNNSITHNSTTRTLNSGETSTITPSNYGAITAKKLFHIDDTVDGTDMVVPVSWAGTEFIFRTRTTASSDEFFAISPWGSATVRLYAAGVEQTGCGSPWTVTSSGSNINCDLAVNTTFRITSTIPIVAFWEQNTTDPYPLYPATTDYLYGFTTSDYHVAAGPNGADYRYIEADDASETDPANLNANESIKTDVGGTYCSLAPRRTYSNTGNGPIGAQQVADADGSDATVHLSRKEFGTKFGSALQADYIAVASDQAATCTVYDTDGSQLSQKTLTGSNTAIYELPAGTDFGRGNSNTYTSGKWTMECDQPVYAVYQHSGDDGERNLWTYPMMRQFTYPTPSVGSPGTEEQAPGPIAYWKFDEGYGDTTYDSTQNNNDGTRGGGTESYKPAWKQEGMCINGKCLEFDGTDDYVSVSNTISGVKTVSFWVKPITTSEYFIDLNGSAYISASSGTISATGFTDPTIYVNGVASTTLTANSWQYISVTTGTGISASAINLGKISSNYLQGFIDEVKIYNYTRTAAQIRQDYLRGAAAQGSSAVLGAEDTSFLNDGLVGYWKMDESSWVGDCSTTDIADSSGNGNNGAACNDTSPAVGKFGNGGSFDGTSDYAEVTNFDRGSKAISFSAWLYLDAHDLSEGNWFANQRDNSTNDQWQILAWTDKKLRVQFFNSSGDLMDMSCISDDDIPLSQWVHIAFSTNGNSGDSASLYMDGVEVATDVLDEDVNYVSDDLIIGTRGWNTSQGELDGKLDEVRIYNRALSPREVRDLYNWAPEPVGYWKMDEASWINDCSTDSVFDSSGNGNNGDACPNSTGPTGGATGKFGKAGSFDGNNDYVNIGTGNTLNLSNNYTICLWLKGNDDWDTMANDQGVFDSGDHGAGYGYHSILKIDANNTNQLQYVTRESDTTRSVFSSKSTWDSNRWYHIAVVHDSSNNILWYIDGVLDDTDNFYILNTANYSGYHFGVRNTGGPSYFNGSIDDVRIYKYARTPKQIIQDMNAGHPAVGSPVGTTVGYWKFDEGYGDTAYDSSPQGNNGDLAGSCPGAATCPSWTNSGKINKALSFDGNNDYVSTPLTSISPDTDSLTATAWIYPTNLTPNNQTVVQQRSGTGQGRTWISINASACGGDKIFSYLGGACTTGTTSLSEDTWYHVAVTSDTSTVKLYVNGKFETSTNPTLEAANGEIVIGISKDLSTLEFNGTIDEVKIYNDTLTEDQIRLDYNQGKAQVLGAVGTDSSGNPSWSSDRSYCPPGDTTASCAPVAEWKFDEKTGTSAYDTSENNNTGTWNGTGSHWVSGKYGSAGQLNGSDDYVDVGSYTIPETVSLSFWVYENGSDVSAGIVYSSKPSDATSDWGARYSTVGNLMFRDYHSGTDSYVDTYIDISSGVWTNIVLVISGSTVSPYKNGQAYSNISLNQSHISRSLDDLRVGHLGGYNENNYHFKGKIDQVKIYDYARTPAQIAWDYNRGKPVGHWKFDECQGGTAYDASGNSNNGIITIGGTGSQDDLGTCTDEDSSHAWYNGRNGKYNYSLNFDGSDDYINASTDDSLKINGSGVTTAAWIKSGDDQGGIFARYANSSPWEGYAMSIGGSLTNGKLGFWYGNNLNWDFSNDTVNDNNWHHVAVVFDSSNSYFYIDGILNATVAKSGTVRLSSDTTAYIGREEPGRYFNGQIDDVRIYNYALTEQQIKNVYNEGAAIRFGPESGAP